MAKSSIRDSYRLLSLSKFKGPSGLHVARRTAFYEHWEDAIAGAVPWERPEEIEREKAKRHAWKSRAKFASEESMLDRFVRDAAANGLAGEAENAKLLFLAMISRFLERLVSFAVKGLSSGGKRFLVDIVLRFLPEEALQARGASPRCINHALAATGTMFNLAVREGHLAHNPLKNAQEVEHHDVRKYRALEDDEIRRLLKASTPEKKRAYGYGPIWIAFLYAGLRLQQLVSLRGRDIDFARRQCRPPKNNTKNRKEYRQPISEEFDGVLREIAAEHKAVHDVNPPREQHVFPNAAGKPWRNNLLARFRRSSNEAGIEHHRVRPDGIEGVVCIHSLRATFATLLADAAVPVKAAQELMQHSSVELTPGLYAKARDHGKQAAVDGLRLLERGRSRPRAARRRAANWGARAPVRVSDRAPSPSACRKGAGDCRLSGSTWRSTAPYARSASRTRQKMGESRSRTVPGSA